MRSIYMDKSTESLCMESEYCIWNGVEDDLLIYPLQLVFWIYTLMLCILVYPSIFTSTSGDSCMLSETTYVSLVNFPPIQNFAVRQPCHRPRIYGQVGIWVFCGCPVFEKKELDFWTTGLGSWGGLRSSRPKLYLHIIIVSWLKPIWAFEARKLFKYNFNWMTWP